MNARRFTSIYIFALLGATVILDRVIPIAPAALVSSYIPWILWSRKVGKQTNGKVAKARFWIFSALFIVWLFLLLQLTIGAGFYWFGVLDEHLSATAAPFIMCLLSLYGLFGLASVPILILNLKSGALKSSVAPSLLLWFGLNMPIFGCILILVTGHTQEIVLGWLLAQMLGYELAFNAVQSE